METLSLDQAICGVKDGCNIAAGITKAYSVEVTAALPRNELVYLSGPCQLNICLRDLLQFMKKGHIEGYGGGSSLLNISLSSRVMHFLLKTVQMRVRLFIYIYIYIFLQIIFFINVILQVQLIGMQVFAVLCISLYIPSSVLKVTKGLCNGAESLLLFFTYKRCICGLN